MSERVSSPLSVCVLIPVRLLVRAEGQVLGFDCSKNFVELWDEMRAVRICERKREKRERENQTDMRERQKRDTKRERGKREITPEGKLEWGDRGRQREINRQRERETVTTHIPVLQ